MPRIGMQCMAHALHTQADPSISINSWFRAFLCQARRSKRWAGGLPDRIAIFLTAPSLRDLKLRAAGAHKIENIACELSRLVSETVL